MQQDQDAEEDDEKWDDAVTDAFLLRLPSLQQKQMPPPPKTSGRNRHFLGQTE